MLKCDYKITNGGEQQDYLYQIKNNIHYKGHVVRYLKSEFDIDNLSMGSVLLGDLEEVG